MHAGLLESYQTELRGDLKRFDRTRFQIGRQLGVEQYRLFYAVHLAELQLQPLPEYNNNFQQSVCWVWECKYNS